MRPDDSKPSAGACPGDTCRALLRRTACVFLIAWLIYIGFLLYSLHPCPRSSNCISALLSGRLAPFSVRALPPPIQPPTELRHIVFGIASAADQLAWRRRYIETWWRPNEMRGYIWLERAPNETESAETARVPPWAVQQNTSHFKFTHPFGPRSAIRVARIAVEMVQLNLSDVRWYMLADDDTIVIPDNLLRVLSKYNHNEYYYVGTFSESVDQNNMHSYGMAFGGGGVALSAALAEAFAATADACMDRYAHFYGSDERIHACISELGVPLTREPGFHQIDLRGNIFGLLAAHPVAPLVTLHHLDSIDPLFPSRTRPEAVRQLMQAAAADPPRVAQQSVCYDSRSNWTVAVSWGYCIQLWDNVVLPHRLEMPMRTFFSWTDYDRTGRTGFVFNTRSVPSDACKRPRVFFLEELISSTDGVNVGSYLARNTSCSRSVLSAVNKITVYSRRRKAHSNSTQAPRRDCCEVVASGKQRLEVVVRNCRVAESVLPPH